MENLNMITDRALDCYRYGFYDECMNMINKADELNKFLFYDKKSISYVQFLKNDCYLTGLTALVLSAR